jgi:hypothetical protein
MVMPLRCKAKSNVRKHDGDRRHSRSCCLPAGHPLEGLHAPLHLRLPAARLSLVPCANTTRRCLSWTSTSPSLTILLTLIDQYQNPLAVCSRRLSSASRPNLSRWPDGLRHQDWRKHARYLVALFALNGRLHRHLHTTWRANPDTLPPTHP